MDGPGILARSISVVHSFGKSGYIGQYHSRSDRHSKVACWAVLFDLLQTSPLLRRHAQEERIVFGVNHEMQDFKQQRKKNLDLVVASPATGSPGPRRRLFAELVTDFGVALDEHEGIRLATLPNISEWPVGSVLLALEAKACMTEHGKAQPRLYDELNSSHLTIHGAVDQAIAVGLAMVNVAPRFLSPGRNPRGLHEPHPRYNPHRQPGDALGVLAKLRQLPRRNRPGEEGFDALGIVVVDCRNDGSPVLVCTVDPAPRPQDDYHYDQMIRRAANQYAYRFSAI